MKIVICGKGGSGKSTITTLLARTLNKAGKRVLVVDADESNRCLHRLLGAPLPEILMDAMGGRKGVREQLNPGPTDNPENALLQDSLTLSNIPPECLADARGVKLLVVGKIRNFGEGCACMVGNISKTILNRLQEKQDDVVLIDAEAGLEHFGRRVNAGCDLILCVVDPSFESVSLADAVRQMADAAGIRVAYILNKVDATVRATMEEKLDSKQVIAAIPKNERLFMQSLTGEALTAEIEEVQAICRYIEAFKKPVSLVVL